ncbi:hypothetical protein B0F90DRAFT_1626650 [Multifurca ochricompacta]|uniref:Cytokinin riboside 5'-monophosphate phosphoribohydrolase n=1 Tax=Multifurca ochricompacta TaxID=376703 RepID=A0AAD4QPF2_9AGAM|nr:hypothetical protein B0F90DRAFT_1626650 [Multifurca ochricompacta]
MSPAPTNSTSDDHLPLAVAVYCGAHAGTEPAFQNAAISLGRALAVQGRSLVYGGGSKGIMGIVSGAALKYGGAVIGVIPSAMLRAGGEGGGKAYIELSEKGREMVRHSTPHPTQKVLSIVVDSMHERKVEMARRVCGFIGLPGGFGTFEEIMEAITWTQLGIHIKPVIIINVQGFFDPLRALIKNAVASGFIKQSNERLIIFIDGPPGADHATFDWGTSALAALDDWSSPGPGLFTWTSGDRDGIAML